MMHTERRVTVLSSKSLQSLASSLVFKEASRAGSHKCDGPPAEGSLTETSLSPTREKTVCLCPRVCAEFVTK